MLTINNTHTKVQYAMAHLGRYNHPDATSMITKRGRGPKVARLCSWTSRQLRLATTVLHQDESNNNEEDSVLHFDYAICNEETNIIDAYADLISHARHNLKAFIDFLQDYLETIICRLHQQDSKTSDSLKEMLAQILEYAAAKKANPLAADELALTAAILDDNSDFLQKYCDDSVLAVSVLWDADMHEAVFEQNESDNSNCVMDVTDAEQAEEEDVTADLVLIDDESVMPKNRDVGFETTLPSNETQDHGSATANTLNESGNAELQTAELIRLQHVEPEHAIVDDLPSNEAIIGSNTPEPAGSTTTTPERDPQEEAKPVNVDSVSAAAPENAIVHDLPSCEPSVGSKNSGCAKPNATTPERNSQEEIELAKVEPVLGAAPEDAIVDNLPPYETCIGSSSPEPAEINTMTPNDNSQEEIKPVNVDPVPAAQDPSNLGLAQCEEVHIKPITTNDNQKQVTAPKPIEKEDARQSTAGDMNTVRSETTKPDYDHLEATAHQTITTEDSLPHYEDVLPDFASIEQSASDNKLCTCEAGRKFTKCCGNKSLDSSSPRSDSTSSHSRTSSNTTVPENIHPETIEKNNDQIESAMPQSTEVRDIVQDLGAAPGPTPHPGAPIQKEGNRNETAASHTTLPISTSEDQKQNTLLKQDHPPPYPTKATTKPVPKNQHNTQPGINTTNLSLKQFEKLQSTTNSSKTQLKASPSDSTKRTEALSNGIKPVEAALQSRDFAAAVLANDRLEEVLLRQNAEAQVITQTPVKLRAESPLGTAAKSIPFEKPKPDTPSQVTTTIPSSRKNQDTAPPSNQSNTKPPARGRPCPCGSRHKYKKCCGKSQDSPSTESGSASSHSRSTSDTTTKTGITTPASVEGTTVDVSQELEKEFAWSTSASDADKVTVPLFFNVIFPNHNRFAEGAM